MGDIEASVTGEPSCMGTNSTNEEDHENSSRTNKSGKSVINSYQSINVLIRTSSQVEERCCPDCLKITFLLLAMIISTLGIGLLYITFSEKNMIEVAQAFKEDKSHQNCTDQMERLNELLNTVDNNYLQFSTFSYIVIGLGVLIVTFTAFASFRELRSTMSAIQDFPILLPLIIVFKSYLVVQVVAIICIAKDRGEVFKLYDPMFECLILSGTKSMIEVLAEMKLFYTDHIHVTKTEWHLMCWAYGWFGFAFFITLIRIIILVVNMCRRKKI